VGTVSLLGNYGPFVLKETFPDPPAPGHSAVVKGNPPAPGVGGRGTETSVPAASSATALQGSFLGSATDAVFAQLGSLSVQHPQGVDGRSASSTPREAPARAIGPAGAADLGLTWIDLSWMEPAWLPDSRKGAAQAR
jgi:hypothetical protein